MGRADTVSNYTLMSENQESRRRSKRNRVSAFDVSRFVQNSTKYSKNKKGSRMANNNQTSQQGVFDMSQTINSHTQQLTGASSSHNPNPTILNQPIGSNVTNPTALQQPIEFDAQLRYLLNESLNETQINLMTMVKESMGKELEKVYAAIGKLSDAFNSLNATTVNSAENRGINNQPPRANQNPTFMTPLPNYASSGSSGTPVSNQVPGACHVAGQPYLTRVEKLGLMFDGKPNGIDVDDFVFRLEHLRALYQIPWNEILANFHYLVSGPANEWYWSKVRNRLVNDWESLKNALYSQYRTNRGNLELVRDIVERKQLPGEPIDKFFQDLNALRLRLDYPVSEFEMIRIAKGNLKRNIAEIIHAMPISSMEQLRIECLEVERRFPRRELRPAAPMANKGYRVSEAQMGLEDYRIYEEVADTEEVSAVSNTVLCWNCRKQGHIFRDCPAEVRSLFCYKCGYANTTSPKCPNCNSGNSRRNGIVAGNHRSTDNLANSIQN